MSRDFSGVLPIVPTPFAVDGSVDVDSLANVTEHAIAKGAAALVYPGVASEDVCLTPQERRTCLATVSGIAKGRIPLVAGVNSAQASEMVEMAGMAAEIGVDGIMAMAVPSMEDDFTEWFRRIASATGGLPIILQNLFKPRGANLSVTQMVELAGAVPEIRYVKEEGIPSGPNVSALAARSGRELDAVIGGGGARYLLEELDRGAVGTMPAIELLELHVALLNAYHSGRRDVAVDLYEKSLPLLLIQAPYRMRLTKFILMQRGLIRHDGVREALPEMDDALKTLVMEFYGRIASTREVELA